MYFRLVLQKQLSDDVVWTLTGDPLGPCGTHVEPPRMVYQIGNWGIWRAGYSLGLFMFLKLFLSSF